MTTYKLDLHSHSTASPDGGITAVQYHLAVTSGLVDYIAITDHNHVDFALQLQKELGDRIIVGEEIMTRQGEIVGLFLKKLIEPGLSLEETVVRIKEQDGLVYIPHPFETVRKGIAPTDLETIQNQIGIMEVCNGRAFTQNRSAQALVWAKLHNVAGAASSDAHGFRGLGKTYTRINEKPTPENLVKVIKHGVPITDRPSVRALLYPKYHKLRKRLRRSAS